MSTNEIDGRAPQHGNRRRLILGIAIAATAVMLIATTATGFFGHRHGHRGHGFDGEEIRFAVEWVLRSADPSDAQVDAISAVAESAHEDLAELTERHRENRAALVAAFTADAIDPAEVEAIRSSAVELAEDASTRVAVALIAMAEELTPEQRRALAERFDRMHERRHGGHESE